jgi:DNA adenine methylase
MKTPISYYGGKQRIASQIVDEIFKLRHKIYTEPFFGGGAVLYEKGVPPSSNQSAYIEAVNDLNKQMITFWRVAREQPDKLERMLALTPHSQEEHRLARDIYGNPDMYSDLEVAWAVYVQCNMSFAHKIRGGWAFAREGSIAAVWVNRMERLPQCFDRLKAVSFGCEDAIDFIKRWDAPDALHYCDPPYPGTNLGHYSGYTMADYEALCAALDAAEGSYILSNYHQEVFPVSAQRVVDIETLMSAARDKSAPTARTEKLWICDRARGAVKWPTNFHRCPIQLDLFALG